MTSKILRRMTLVAGALSLAIAISAQSVLADNNDDDDDDDRRGNRACKVLMAKVDTEVNTATVTGKNFPRRPRVWFGGVSVPVLYDPLPSRTEIVIDLSAALDGLDGPKDFLLEIKRCPSHLVTVVPGHCHDNGDCSNDEFCSKPVGACGNVGMCSPVVSKACTRILRPVCGCDGLDYANACVAETMGASIDHAGECNGPFPPFPRLGE